MDNNNSPFNRYDHLFSEYIRMIDNANTTSREVNTQLLGILNTYLTILNTQTVNQQTTSDNIRSLLQRYYENFRTQQYEDRNSDRIRERYNRNLRRRTNIFNLNRESTIDNNRNNNTDNISASTTNTNTNLLSRPTSTINRPFNNPLITRPRISSFNTRNRHRTTNTPFTFSGFSTRQNTTRDTFNRIINESFNIPPIHNPITRSRVDEVTTRSQWSDIVSTIDQFICPITRDRFRDDDFVLRINHCGHVFNESALITYLTEYDYRCPVCRFNLRNTLPSTNNINNDNNDNNLTPASIDSATSTGSANSTGSTGGSATTAAPLASFTFSLPQLNSTNTNTNTNNLYDISNNSFNFDNNINLQNIMTDVVNDLTNALNDPNILNSNSLSAEYSFFLPQNINATPAAATATATATAAATAAAATAAAAAAAAAYTDNATASITATTQTPENTDSMSSQNNSTQNLHLE